ncbi:MAG: hypothetical protein DMG35_21050 [Acidobacteria bacterium]|nr:MAG: hypothetical protein DMG35_21050 [Acidobacteriota bacterium]
MKHNNTTHTTTEKRGQATFYEEGAMKSRGGWLAMMVGLVMVGCGVEGTLEKAAGKTADQIKDAMQLRRNDELGAGEGIC